MLQIQQVRTEYLINPLGIDRVNPTFSYTLKGDSNSQSAYQLVCAYDESFEHIAYDTGKVESATMSGIRYQGKSLKSRDRIFVRIKVWDEHGIESTWSETSFFEMGLLNPSDWKAKWTSGNYKPKKNMRWPVDCFQKLFEAGEDIDHARLYITACGLYEAKLNGARVGDFVLAPGCTDYRKRLQYQTYDVAELLQQGENALEIQLADGWYRGSIGCFGLTNVYGRQTKLLCQLEITYADGTAETIVSDESFRWSNDGPIRFADLKDGEIYDASMRSSYSGKALLAKEKRIPVSSNNVPVTEHEVFAPTLITTPKGKKVFDFGQNIAGFISFNLKGKKGQIVRMRFGELMDDEGEFSQSNIHKHHKPVKEIGKITEMKLMLGKEDKVKGEMQPTPKQELEFICSGGEDHYKMTFAVFGFQYVQIETDVTFAAEDFKAIAVYSDLEETGDFVCSNEDVNKLLQNTRWSMKGNFLDLPTDCPTRERLGWTGEGQTFFYTANYLMGAMPFYRKWLHDIEDGQKKNGKISAVAPYVGMDLLYGNTGNSVGWGDAAVLIPYRYWKLYGDESILSEFYDGLMRSYAMLMIKNTGHKDKKAAKANPFNKYTYEKGFHLGEWLEPADVQDTVKAGNKKLHTEVCTAYLHYTMDCMAEVAHVLGRSEDEGLFKEYADGAVKAYDWLFLREGAPDTDRQARLIRPLALGLAEGEKKKALEDRLVQAVENRGYRIGTGFLSTPFVLPVLTEAGRTDVAYKMLENEQAPSWLAEVKTGATTMWEDWEGSELISRNHYAQGAVCQWLFDTVCGIRVDGVNHFVIKPVPGGTLTWAEGYYNSLYGMVRVKWEKKENGIHFYVEIPCNTAADIQLPNGEMHTVSGGNYEFETN